MTIYHRHFKIEDSATVIELNSMLELRNAYLGDLDKIKDEIGAVGYRNFAKTYELAGFSFDSEPNKEHWKKSNGLWLPKRKSNIGKALSDRILSLGLPPNINSVLPSHGLSIDFPGALIQGLTMYYCSVCGSTEKGWFATIPWKDISPKEIQTYIEERSNGCRFDSDLEHLQWQIPSDWVEVKEWEVLKAMADK